MNDILLETLELALREIDEHNREHKYITLGKKIIQIKGAIVLRKMCRDNISLLIEERDRFRTALEKIEIRCRQATQTIIESIGSIGPESVENSAIRIVDRLEELKEQVNELMSDTSVDAVRISIERDGLRYEIQRLENELHERNRRYNKLFDSTQKISDEDKIAEVLEIVKAIKDELS